MSSGVREASFQQIEPIEFRPAPYVFCCSRKPGTAAGLQARKKATNEDYDAWYPVENPGALGRELENAVGGWLFDRQVARYTLHRAYGWVHYYVGDRPPIIGNLEKGFDEGLNQVERFFAMLTDKQLRRGVHRSTRELEQAIRDYIDTVNANPRPFRWTKSANDILATIKRFCLRTLDTAPLQHELIKTAESGR